ncbi:MAG: HNH endonuclease [Betaproteobacteria bacterium]|nr:HNH endonuclease [Betaproteobacteria bacterium]
MVITQKEIKRLFDYRNGHLYWKISPCPTVGIGHRAGNLHPIGYRWVKYQGVRYPEHKLIFKYHHGYWPTLIDHKDRNKSNNKIGNLRECTFSQNGFNSDTRSDNTSGIKGVCWNKKNNKWLSRIMINKKSINLGYFKNLDDAKNAVMEARNKYHGDFCNHG